MIDDPGDPSARRDAAPGATQRIVSTELFRGQREVVIVHRGQEYRLHITKAGKLILTK
ncbi:MAG TPA: hemin uptake protein HemP [Methylomirabilota bacterium]|nr:hemin uptake protein HemP [Methylomirabilota bacterium]